MSTEALQGALRMLFLLDKAGSPVVPGGSATPAGAVAVIDSEKKLQALHFWMRNPDYLAYEILDGVEQGTLEVEWVAKAEQLLEDDEPVLRRYPMLRYLFGAFEPIDDSFSILAAPGLAKRLRYGAPGNVQRSAFYLLEPGREHAMRITDQHPELQWYPERAGLIAQVSAGRTGSDLKVSQYQLAEYARTELGDQIQPIDDLVHDKLEILRSPT